MLKYNKKFRAYYQKLLFQDQNICRAAPFYLRKFFTLEGAACCFNLWFCSYAFVYLTQRSKVSFFGHIIWLKFAYLLDLIQFMFLYTSLYKFCVVRWSCFDGMLNLVFEIIACKYIFTYALLRNLYTK